MKNANFASAKAVNQRMNYFMTLSAKQPVAILFLCLSLVACKEKKKEEPQAAKEEFFPAISFIKNQVAHVDTSLYTIRVITAIDSVREDTAYIRREQFKGIARDFLSLPDISKAEYNGRYTESESYDETINRLQLLYTPVKEDEEIIKSQQISIKPDPSGDKVSSIYITTGISTRDSLVEKKMLWMIDQSFQVTTIRQLVGQPEVTSTIKVVWNESDPE
jgi:hypothetical protein